MALLTIGSSESAALEALAELADEGIHLDYCRVRAFPFTRAVEQFLADHELIFVLEQNRDAQLKTLIITETDCEKKKLRSILSYDGLSIASACVMDAIREHVAEESAA